MCYEQNQLLHATFIDLTAVLSAANISGMCITYKRIGSPQTPVQRHSKVT